MSRVIIVLLVLVAVGAALYVAFSDVTTPTPDVTPRPGPVSPEPGTRPAGPQDNGSGGAPEGPNTPTEEGTTPEVTGNGDQDSNAGSQVETVPPPAGDSLAARIAAVPQQPTADDARKALLALVPEMVEGLEQAELEALTTTLEQLADPELERRLVGYDALYRMGLVRDFMRSRTEPQVINAVVRAESQVADEDAAAWLHERLIRTPQDPVADMVRYLNVVRFLIAGGGETLDPTLQEHLKEAQQRLDGMGQALDVASFLQESVSGLPDGRRSQWEDFLGQLRQPR